MQREKCINNLCTQSLHIMNTQHCCIIPASEAHVNKMNSTQTMSKEELYNIGACDYDSVYMSEVRNG